MMFLVVTTVEVVPDSIDVLAALFDETNRELVAGHDDWLSADFTADREANTVMVVARWRRAESYVALRESPEFGATMALFAPHFAGPPTVATYEVLVHMESVAG